LTPNANTTVRELALGLPQATRVFERLKIDYCCGGAQPLDAACSAAGLDVVTVIKQLAEKRALRGRATGRLTFRPRRSPR